MHLLAAADSLFSTAELPRAATKRTRDNDDVINSILQTGLIYQIEILEKQKQEKNGFAQKPNNYRRGAIFPDQTNSNNLKKQLS